jgi:hypothetical protein
MSKDSDATGSLESIVSSPQNPTLWPLWSHLEPTLDVFFVPC